MSNSLRNQVFERYEFKVGDISASIYLQPWFCNEKPGFLSPLRLIKHNRLKILALDEVPDKLCVAIEDLKANKVPYVLIHDGVVHAVLIDLQEYEDLLEEAALSIDPEHLAMIAEARAAYCAGEGGNYEGLRQEILDQVDSGA